MYNKIFPLLEWKRVLWIIVVVLMGLWLLLLSLGLGLRNSTSSVGGIVKAAMVLLPSDGLSGGGRVIKT